MFYEELRLIISVAITDFGKEKKETLLGTFFSISFSLISWCKCQVLTRKLGLSDKEIEEKVASLVKPAA